MTAALWILNGFLALCYLGTGSLKAFVPKPRMRASGIGWTDDFSQGTIRLLGVNELLGAAGLILPLATGILPLLAPIASVCLAVQMIGAISVHIRRRENFAPSGILFVLDIASAVLGFLVIL